jgi:hypothetical protein
VFSCPPDQAASDPERDEQPEQLVSDTFFVLERMRSRGGIMRLGLALIAFVVFLGEARSAEQTTFNSRTKSTTVAQSYCAICGSDRTNCVVRCNGSGACVQKCDDDYRLCVERACSR